MTERPDPYAPTGLSRVLESAAAWALAVLWVLPLAYAVWAAFQAVSKLARVSGAVSAKCAENSAEWNAAHSA